MEDAAANGIKAALLVAFLGLVPLWRGAAPEDRRGGTGFLVISAFWLFDVAVAFVCLIWPVAAHMPDIDLDTLRFTLRTVALMMFCQSGVALGARPWQSFSATAALAGLLIVACQLGSSALSHTGPPQRWIESQLVALGVSCLVHTAGMRLRKRSVPWPHPRRILAWVSVTIVGMLLTLRSIELHGTRPAYDQIVLDCAFVLMAAALWARSSRHQQPISVAAPQGQAKFVEYALHQQRQRIAQDLHDGVGSHLLSVIARQTDDTDAQRQTVAALQACMLELRIAVDRLFESDESLLISLGMLRYRMQPALDRLAIHMEWLIGEPATRDRLTSSDVRELLLIVQEALSNVLRHSQASRVSVILDYSKVGFMVLEIVDNGRGIPDAPMDAHRASGGGGRGLQGLRQRAERLGADFALQSDSKTGTSVRLTIPL